MASEVLRIARFTTGNCLQGRGAEYVSWTPGDTRVDLDGRFTAEELEEIANWMRSKCDADYE